MELAGDPAELRLKLAIDEAHARWPKAPRGDFFVGAFLGAGFSGGLGSGAGHITISIGGGEMITTSGRTT